MCVCVCVCVCGCVCERERARESVCVCSMYTYVHMHIHIDDTTPPTHTHKNTCLERVVSCGVVFQDFLGFLKRVRPLEARGPARLACTHGTRLRAISFGGTRCVSVEPVALLGMLGRVSGVCKDVLVVAYETLCFRRLCVCVRARVRAHV